MKNPSFLSLFVLVAGVSSVACGQLVEDKSAPSTPETSPTLTAVGDACMEEIREPQKGYTIARIIRSYDHASRIVSEDLVDLHPNHTLQAGCYVLPTGYSRRSHEWKYDPGGRTIFDRLVDQGDGESCSGTNVRSEFERTWIFDPAGRPLHERERHLRGEYETTLDTEHTYVNGNIATTVASRPGSSGQPAMKQTTTWTYNKQGQAIQKELRTLNGTEDIHQSRTRWEYDASGLSVSEISEEEGRARTFRRIEKRVFDKVGHVAEEWVDYSTRIPNSNATGAYVADGSFDSKAEYNYDARGNKLSERQIVLANGALNARVLFDNYWTYDAQNRVTTERNIGGQRRENTYGPNGIALSQVFDTASTELARVTFVYDTKGRHLRTVRLDRGVEWAEEFDAPWTQFEYDEKGWLSRSFLDMNHDGQWDEERRFTYACGVEFTSKLGREPVLPF